VQEGKTYSRDASDDFFLQAGDPEDAAAMHESQHAPAKLEVPAHIARKAHVSARGGAVLMSINVMFRDEYRSVCQLPTARFCSRLHVTQVLCRNKRAGYHRIGRWKTGSALCRAARVSSGAAAFSGRVKLQQQYNLAMKRELAQTGVRRQIRAWLENLPQLTLRLMPLYPA